MSEKLPVKLDVRCPSCGLRASHVAMDTSRNMFCMDSACGAKLDPKHRNRWDLTPPPAGRPTDGQHAWSYLFDPDQRAAKREAEREAAKSLLAIGGRRRRFA